MIYPNIHLEAAYILYKETPQTLCNKAIRGGSRISEKGLHIMYQGVGVRFDGFISFFLKGPLEIK